LEEWHNFCHPTSTCSLSRSLLGNNTQEATDFLIGSFTMHFVWKHHQYWGFNKGDLHATWCSWLLLQQLLQPCFKLGVTFLRPSRVLMYTNIPLYPWQKNVGPMMPKTNNSMWDHHRINLGPHAGCSRKNMTCGNLLAVVDLQVQSSHFVATDTQPCSKSSYHRCSNL
jgi:hypothetical protein